jgi:hypothetical protein
MADWVAITNDESPVKTRFVKLEKFVLFGICQENENDEIVYVLKGQTNENYSIRICAFYNREQAEEELDKLLQ